MASGKPCGQQRSSMGEIESYEAHLRNLKNAEKKTDNSAPPLPLSSILQAGIYIGDLSRLVQLEEENKNMLRKINIINRTGGKVDSSAPNTLKKSNYEARQFHNKRIEADNLLFVERLKTQVSQFDTRRMEKEYQEEHQKMIFNSRHPEFYQKCPNPLDTWTICPDLGKPKCDPSKRVKCYFNLEIPNEFKFGRIVFEIYRDFVPIAGDNFVRLCRGENGLTYKNTRIHRIVPNWVCMGGILENSNDNVSVYGGPFEDEGHLLRFAGPGVISTHNFQEGMNTSRFMITFRELNTQNNRFVVFGRVIRSLDVLQKLQEFGTHSGKVLAKVLITDCGVLGEKGKQKTAPKIKFQDEIIEEAV